MLTQTSLSSFVQDDITAALGEPLSAVLDMGTWHDGQDLARLYDDLRRVVAERVEQERRTSAPVRGLVFGRLREARDRLAPRASGVYQLTEAEVKAVHAGLLFNGGTECCDGTVAIHDSVALAIVQIGVSLVAYRGGQGAWVQRFYRRDVSARYDDPVEEALALLERRARPDSDERGQPFARLFGRALMEYAERAALSDLSAAVWRMGHGSPVPLTMLIPTTPDLLQAGLAVLRRLILEQRRFVYVASDPADRLLLTIGHALLPLEYAVVHTLEHQYGDRQLHRLETTERGHPREAALVQEFLRQVRGEVAVGVFRAGEHAPPRVFYAHQEHIHQAAALAVADAVLQPLRGFPMLIDLADLVCRNTFDSGSFRGTIYDAYAAAGEPTRFLGERETRS